MSTRSREQGWLVDSAFVCALVLPTLAWVLMDHSVWESDPAFYGISAVRLFDAMLLGGQEWWSAMMALLTRPPLMAWIGQFLVPLGAFLGNIDAGLLLLNVAAQLTVLWLVYMAAMDLFSDRRLGRLCALLVASAPMFGWVSRQFLVQTVQLAVVSWYVLIMCRATKWDRLFTILSLAAVTALAPLTMLSTPAYCFVPATLALWIAFRSGPSMTVVTGRHVAMAFVTAVMLRLSIPWYRLHLADVLEYGRHAFGFVWAGTPGAGYPARFAIWLSRLFSGGFIIPVGVAVAVAVVAAVALRRPRSATRDLRLWAVALQVPVTLAVLAIAQQQEPRYILPLLGCVALSVAWLVRATPRAQQAITALLLAQFVLVTLDAHGIIPSTSTYPHRVQREPDPRFALMDGVLALREVGAQRVMLVLGAFELYSEQVDYYARKSTTDTRTLGLNSGEFVYLKGETRGNLASAWAAIEEWNPDHVVTANAEVRRQQRALWEGSPRGWGLVMRASADIADMVEASPRYERLPITDTQLVYYRRRR